MLCCNLLNAGSLCLGLEHLCSTIRANAAVIQLAVLNEKTINVATILFGGLLIH